MSDDDVGGTCSVCGEVLRYGGRHRKCGAEAMNPASQAGPLPQSGPKPRTWLWDGVNAPEPLFDQASIDARFTEAVERCAKVCIEQFPRGTIGHTTAMCIAESIRAEVKP